jgi:hypothetical protein
VRQPSSTDLLAIWERGAGQDSLDQAVTMLAGVTGLPWPAAADTDIARRDALLVTALRALRGDALVVGVLSCTGCGVLLDVPVDLTALPAPPDGPPPTADGVAVTLPTSADLRRIRGSTPEAARAALLARCCGAAGANGIAALEAAAPASAVTITAGCPDCATTTSADLDVSVLLWAEIERRALDLLSQVHLLASAYGWTEPEVLALTPRRRAAYLRMAAPA